MSEGNQGERDPHIHSSEQQTARAGTRSRRITANVILSLLVKGGGAAISYLMVPIALAILDTTDYGVWLTISSLVTWIAFFDLGLTNGLRNRLAESLATDNSLLARKLVSTAFALMVCIMAAVFLVYICLRPVLDWATILNTPAERATELGSMATVVVGAFSLTFVLNIVGVVFMASQRPAFNDLIVFVGQLLGFVALTMIARVLSTSATLLSVSAILSLSPVAAMGGAFIFAFAGRYKSLRPSLRSIDWGLSRSILGLGTRFLLVRLASLAVFSLSLVVISRVVGPEYVAEFSIARKYFRIVSIVATIVTTPVWAATTEAFVVGDIDWIRRIVRRLLLLFGFALLAIGLMVGLADWVYGVWLGDSISIALPLTLAFAAFAALDAWNSVFAFIVAGSGKMLVTSILAVASVATFLPLSVVLGRSFGTVGVAIATSIALAYWAVQLPIQTRKLLNGTAIGLWDR